MSSIWRALRRFFRTPKGLLTIVLAALIAIAGAFQGFTLVLPGLIAATLAAMAVDLPVLRWRKGVWEFPSGALLTGWIVAMVLSPHEPWRIVAATSAYAVMSKYFFRTKSANIFNPAGFALVLSFYLYDTAQDWWGALANVPLVAILALAGTGVFITDRVNKMPIAMTFLGVHFLLFTAAAFAGSPAQVAGVFRAPDLHAALFFAFFMVTDPPTAPIRVPDQIVCGALVAVVSFGTFEIVGAVYYLLAGLLAGNLWEAARRMRLQKVKA